MKRTNKIQQLKSEISILKSKSIDVVHESILSELSQHIQRKIRNCLQNSCRTYNAILTMKDRKSAHSLMNLAIQNNINKITELCKELDNEKLLTHTLCLHKKYYIKYLTAIDFFYYQDRNDAYIWRKPLIGDTMKIKSNIILHDNKNKIINVIIIDMIHKKGDANILKAIVEYNNIQYECNFGDLKQF